MKAVLITPENQTLEVIEIADQGDIAAAIGYDTLESDTVGSQGDRLFFDEECFLRGSSGRFQLDTLIPVSGKGVIVGTAADGTSLQDVQTDLEELRQRIKYLQANKTD